MSSRNCSCWYGVSINWVRSQQEPGSHKPVRLCGCFQFSVFQNEGKLNLANFNTTSKCIKFMYCIVPKNLSQELLRKIVVTISLLGKIITLTVYFNSRTKRMHVQLANIRKAAAMKENWKFKFRLASRASIFIRSSCTFLFALNWP